MRKCCKNCFGDSFLEQQIELISQENGTCDFCNSAAVVLVEPSKLTDSFETLFSLYEESQAAAASSIESLLRTDWELFGSLESVKTEMLLSLIFNDIDLVQKSYAPVIQHDASAVQEWEAFREELKHQNRFFPKNIQTTEQLKELFGFLTAPLAAIPEKVSRARICEQAYIYPLEQMGKPPEALVGNGRANPVGIPCLYVASDTMTAIAEIRPNKGEIVCVAEYTVDRTALLADLRFPRKSISPFLLTEDQIKLLRRYMEYLCRLSEELTFPVLPKSAHLDYLPSQYLCEFIKHCGFDGVIYRSAMSTGTNYALFNDIKVTGIDVKPYRIDDIHVGFSDL